MIKVLSRIPSYYLFRLVGWPTKFPINLTLSISYKCNSRCKTCNVYKKEAAEFSVKEWKKVFEGLGTSPFWVTISGGEPFLRSDLSEIVCSLYDQCHPEIINIPTNGILNERIPKIVEGIALHCKKAQIVINVSLDEIEENHDEIRGIPGNFKKTIQSFSALKSLSLPNLSVGIHTVISKYNVSRIPDIYHHLSSLNPDSYITEIAEEREELNTIGSGITPEYNDYADAVDFLCKVLKKDHFNKVGKITRAFRLEYYRLVKEILKEHRQIIPCYAGFASAQIAPDGDVWLCCIKAESIGSLRDVDYDFRKVWLSGRADELRREIKDGVCYCPLANAGYTNMLHNIRTLYRVGCNLIKD